MEVKLTPGNSQKGQQIGTGRAPGAAAAVTKGALKLVWAEEKQREELGREACRESLLARKSDIQDQELEGGALPFELSS